MLDQRTREGRVYPQAVMRSWEVVPVRYAQGCGVAGGVKMRWPSTTEGRPPFPPGGGRPGWRGTLAWLSPDEHPHPDPPPSRRRGTEAMGAEAPFTWRLCPLGERAG
jgi:hypothetical protein